MEKNNSYVRKIERSLTITMSKHVNESAPLLCFLLFIDIYIDEWEGWTTMPLVLFAIRLHTHTHSSRNIYKNSCANYHLIQKHALRLHIFHFITKMRGNWPKICTFPPYNDQTTKCDFFKFVTNDGLLFSSRITRFRLWRVILESARWIENSCIYARIQDECESSLKTNKKQSVEI